MLTPDCILDDIGVSLIESSLSKRVRPSQCHWHQSTLEEKNLVQLVFSTVFGNYLGLSPGDLTVSTPPLRHSMGLDRIVKPVLQELFRIRITWSSLVSLDGVFHITAILAFSIGNQQAFFN